MATVTSYPHGVPNWLDLATPDPEASKAFYAALFGWEYDSQATDGPSDYVMAQRKGHNAAGMMQLSAEMAAGGMPPVWSTYVNVDDLDATIAKIRDEGGSVMGPAQDAMDAGRFVVVADPAGAVFCLWEAKEHVGAGIVDEHGSFSWAELITPDPAAVAPFYRSVFGWASEATPMPNGDYLVFTVDGGSENGIAGAMSPPVEGMPAFWGVYFAVDDAAATVATAKELGAQIMLEATPMPGVGTLATIADPQGAAFSIMAPEAS